MLCNVCSRRRGNEECCPRLKEGGKQEMLSEIERRRFAVFAHNFNFATVSNLYDMWPLNCHNICNFHYENAILIPIVIDVSKCVIINLSFITELPVVHVL